MRDSKLASRIVELNEQLASLLKRQKRYKFLLTGIEKQILEVKAELEKLLETY